MRRIIAIANQKGGVGKTTTAINLSAGLAQKGHWTLLADLDAQGNATMGSGIEKRDLEWTIGQALIEQASFDQVRRKTEHGYDLLPANTDLSDAESLWLKKPRRYAVLREFLDGNALDYDYIIIDCPPGLNLFTVGALLASDGLIVPMQCEYFALEGLSDLLHIVTELRDRVGAKVQLWGILRTMHDPRYRLGQSVSEQLCQHFSDKVLDTVIPRNISLAESPGFGLPIQAYEPRSKGAIAYTELTEELLERLGASAGSAQTLSRAY